MARSDHQVLRASILLVALLVYVYPLTLGTPLFDPDEGLHASIAQEMVETGDYVVPRFLGEPFLDKPILYFFAQTVSLRILGMTELAVRLPGSVFALIAAWTTWLLAKHLFSRQVARLACLVFMTLLMPMALAQAPAHDISLVPTTNLLLLSLWTMQHANEAAKRGTAFVQTILCVALALLSKGLIGIAVVSVGYCGYLVWQRCLSWRLLRCYGLASLFGVAVASPWFISMEISEPGYLKYYFFDRHVLGFATDTQTHGKEPWFYYLPPLVIGTFPWFIHALIGLPEILSNRSRTRENDSLRLVICWLIGGLLFLSIAHSKLVTYTLPLYPGVALAVAVVWSRFLDGRFSDSVRVRLARAFSQGTVVGMVVPLVVLASLKVWFQLNVGLASWVAAATLGIMSGAIHLVFRHGCHSQALASGAIWIALWFTSIMASPIQQIAPLYSCRSLANQIDSRDEKIRHVLLVGDRSASLVFYLSSEHRKLIRSRGRAFASPTDAVAWEKPPTDDLVIVTENALEECPELSTMVPNGATRRFNFVTPASYTTTTEKDRRDGSATR